MRMSCNGCRVLRKGCSDSCVLRPCLEWIRTAESQANAIVFLVKFYGRAGLTNLISNGPEHLRPAIFRSLLYDACGRMVNPIYGSVGLLCSGNWALCEAGLESVLQGSFSTDTKGNFPSHIVPVRAMAVRKLYRSVKARGRFKGFSHSKPRQKEHDHAPVYSDMDSGSKSDDLGNVTNTLQKAADNSKFNEKCVEKYSTFLSGKELDEFVATHQAQIESFHDLCNVGSSIQTEGSACNAVGLELTLGSQSFTSPVTPPLQ